MADLLKGRNAVVTGAGRGIGRGIAIALAAEGAKVVVNDPGVASDGSGFDKSPADEVAEAIRSQGGTAIPSYDSVATVEGGENIIKTCVDNFGRIDILVNNAGGATAGYGVDLQFISDQDWRVGIDTNLTSAFYCARAVIPHLLKQGSGKIINTASGFGLRGARNNWTYVAAKAGLINFTRSLALTYAENNIQANCIAPGLFPHNEEMVRYWRGGKFIPVGRLGRAEELGPLVVFLASPLSDHMTGETIIIDGGGLAGGHAPTGLAPVIPL